MHNIIQTIQHAARAATVLLIALLAAQTAGAQTNVSDADGLVGAFDDTNVSIINVTDNITGVDYTLSPSWHDITIYLDGHTISGNRLSFNTNGCKLTINGMPLTQKPTAKGIYIYNGKKVVMQSLGGLNSF